MFFENIEQFVESDSDLRVDKNGTPTRSDFQIAVAVLLLAMAFQDQEFAKEEYQEIKISLSKHFDIDKKQCDRLIEVARTIQRNAHKLDFFLKTIDYHFTTPKKQTILSMLWAVAEADGVVKDVEAELAADVRIRLGLSLEQAMHARELAEVDLG